MPFRFTGPGYYVTRDGRRALVGFDRHIDNRPWLVRYRMLSGIIYDNEDDELPHIRRNVYRPAMWHYNGVYHGQGVVVDDPRRIVGRWADRLDLERRGVIERRGLGRVVLDLEVDARPIRVGRAAVNDNKAPNPLEEGVKRLENGDIIV